MNGDGLEDLYTGCFEGCIYVIPRKKDKSYGKPYRLLDKAGNILRVGQYWDYDLKKWTNVETSRFKEFLGISATAVDWDEDGDLDLVIGSNEGRIFVRFNEGSAAKPAFATESTPLKAGSASMEVKGGGAIPAVADWDGDGLFDLISGSGDGGVVWFRNVGEKGKPAFAAAQVLLGKPKKSDEEPAGPASRTLVYATDFDADGDLDLLVGDNTFRPERHGWVWLVKRENVESR